MEGHFLCIAVSIICASLGEKLLTGKKGWLLVCTGKIFLLDEVRVYSGPSNRNLSMFVCSNCMSSSLTCIDCAMFVSFSFLFMYQWRASRKKKISSWRRKLRLQPLMSPTQLRRIAYGATLVFLQLVLRVSSLVCHPDLWLTNCDRWAVMRVCMCYVSIDL